MFLEKWKQHLSQSNTSNYAFDNFSDFISFPTFLDMFKGDISILSFPFNGSFNHYNLHNIFNSYDYYNLFASTNYFDMSSTNFTSANSLFSEIEYLSFLKNDVDSLGQIFPEYEDIIFDLDIWSRYGEESLQYVDSTPDVKLYYPEPFIASPSFVHEELWFIHILHYQHWLWFMFITLVMFYFITFINVVRWCNLRTKPKRETRGVSRSKCADLITACVPVSWAASIIISETVDATDYYDGFGTGEIVIGIRAYQWGWEYFYPKGIDLHYNVKPSYSTMLGNSVKYNNSSSSTTSTSSIWKSYQGKNLQSLTVAPAHVLLSPMANNGSIDLVNFSKVGLSTLKDSSAFKKIQYHSKVNPHDMYNDFSNSSLRYNKLYNLYLSSNRFLESYNYGTFRQKGSSALASNSYNNLGFEKKALSKLLNYNFNTNTSAKAILFPGNIVLPDRSPTLGNLHSNISLSSLKTTNSLSALSEATNSNSKYGLGLTTDGKYYTNPFKYYGASINGFTQNPNLLSDGTDLLISSNTTSPVLDLNNFNKSYKFQDLKSNNLNFLSSDKNVRSLDQISPSKNLLNFMGEATNLLTLTSSSIEKNVTPNEFNIFLNSKNNWVNSTVTDKLVMSGLSLTPSHTPVYSNSPNRSDKSFDQFQNGFDDQSPTMLRSKEETAPTYLFSSYWNTYWSNSNTKHRFNSLRNTSDFVSKFYLPTPTEYAEYDFKNIQALELLEDSFWESTFSSFSQDEYLNILQNSKEYLLFKKQEELFNNSTRSKKFKNSQFAKPLLKSLFTDSSNINSLPIYSEDSIIPSNLVSLNRFYILPLESSVELMDESFDSMKYMKYINFNKYKTLFSISSNSTSPYAYTTILDPFRADYEDIVWNFDTQSSSNDTFSQLSNQDDLKLSNSTKLRSTARNAIVTYNAIQKVFKSRLDEGRSHSRIQDFSHSYISHPFVTSPKSPYESMLSKNKESFFNVQSYNHFKSQNFNTLFSVWNSLNSTFLDIPFLISAKSDPSRYLWFDWQSRWSSTEVQPSSVARYSLSGVPYFTKSYEYDTQSGDDLNESENYLNRLARARKNYLPNWSHTPYFYSRVSNWYRLNSLVSTSYQNLSFTRSLLESSSSYWTSVNYFTQTSSNFTPSSSGVNTPTRSSWRPLSGIQGYYYSVSTLVDILTKREYLYRSYFNSKGFIAALPTYLTASPTNSLLNEVQKGYNLVDPVTFSSEISRELTYQNLNQLRFSLVKDLSYSVSQLLGLNMSVIDNYFLFYLLGSTTSQDLGNNNNLLKNQYRPMKKGVTNMIRLQATGAIAMPTEIRLHILASSRDVIHSWAIPSAGIKIDCVPGYSSHRVAIFLVSGIFWGQCMEICGRFHHWMPIIVYFMKRDLFFLWCTHFMHYSSSLDLFDLTDKQLSDKLRLASFDKTSWVKEINKTI